MTHICIDIIDEIMKRAKGLSTAEFCRWQSAGGEQVASLENTTVVQPRKIGQIHLPAASFEGKRGTNRENNENIMFMRDDGGLLLDS